MRIIRSKANKDLKNAVGEVDNHLLQNTSQDSVGGTWYKIIPYEDGTLPLVTMLTPSQFLYIKRDGPVEFFVKTHTPPEVLSSAGYVVARHPVRNEGNRAVYVRSAYVKEDSFIDFVIEDMIDVLQAMPNHSAISVIIALPDDFKPVKRLKLKSFGKSANIKIKDVEKIPYSVHLSILGENEDALNSLEDFIITRVNADVRWHKYKLTWIDALSKLPEPLSRKLIHKLLSLEVPRATIEALKSWLILPNSKVSRCIPKGTVPAGIISRSDGFRIGLGADGHELRLRADDFRNHCIIIGKNPDLLTNIVENLRKQGTVIIIDFKNTLLEYLLSKGVACADYSEPSISVNPFDLPACIDKELAIDILINTFENVLNLPLDADRLKQFLRILYRRIDDPTPEMIFDLISDLLNDKLYADYDEDLQILRSTMDMVLYNAVGLLSNETDFTTIPIEDTLQPKKVVAFNLFTGRISLLYALLIRYLTEIRALKAIGKLNWPVYFILNCTEDILHLLDLKDVSFIICLDEKIDECSAGVRFEVDGYNARVWINEKGPAAVRIDRLELKPARKLRGNMLPSKARKSDYREILFGPVLKYIDPEDALRAIVLYAIYSGNYDFIGKLKWNGVDVNSIGTWLYEKDFIKKATDSNKVIEYNNGFEKWSKSAVPSLEGEDLISEIVDYYFAKNYCVIPVKQRPGMRAPDLIAVKFNPDNLRIIYREAIAIEVEAHANKGKRTLEQIRINMIKNREFKETHVWAYTKDEELITKIYNELSDDVRSRVKLFFRSKDESKEDSIQLKDRDDTQTRLSVKRMRKDAKRRTAIGTTLSQFIQHWEPAGAVKDDVKEEKNEEGSIKIEVNGRIYELEPSEAAIKLKEIVEDIKRGKRNERVVEKNGFLRVIDDRGIKLIEAKIKNA